MNMASPSLAAELALLQILLEPFLPGIQVRYKKQIDSTNSALMRHFKSLPTGLRDTLPSPTATPQLLLAGMQTAGRGRMGRVWHNADDSADQDDALAGKLGDADGGDGPGQLLFSLGLPLAQGPGGSALSLVVGICVAEALQAVLSAEMKLGPENDDMINYRIGLKWPNDVWLCNRIDGSERKLAGILVETASWGEARRTTVIGIGINLQAPAPWVDAMVEIPTGAIRVAVAPVAAAGLREVCPGVSAATVLRQVVLRLAQALAPFQTGGFSVFQTRFVACDVLAGRAVQLSDGSSGVACGVDASGALQMRGENGVMQSVSSSEVSVRPLSADTLEMVSPC